MERERGRGWNVEGSKRGLRNFICFSSFSSSSSSLLFSGRKEQVVCFRVRQRLSLKRKLSPCINLYVLHPPLQLSTETQCGTHLKMTILFLSGKNSSF